MTRKKEDKMETVVGTSTELRPLPVINVIEKYMQAVEDKAHQSKTYCCATTTEQGRALVVGCLDMVWCFLGFLLYSGGFFYSLCILKTKVITIDDLKRWEREMKDNYSFSILFVIMSLWLLGILNGFILVRGAVNRNYCAVKLWFIVTWLLLIIRVTFQVAFWLAGIYGDPCKMIPTLVPLPVEDCSLSWSEQTELDFLHYAFYKLYVVLSFGFTLKELAVVSVYYESLQSINHCKYGLKLYKRYLETLSRKNKSGQRTESSQSV